MVKERLNPLWWRGANMSLPWLFTGLAQDYCPVMDIE